MNSLFNNLRFNFSKLYENVNILNITRTKVASSYCIKTKSSAVKRFSLNKGNGKVKFHPRANPDTTAYIKNKLYTSTFKACLFSGHPGRKSTIKSKNNPFLIQTTISN
ncbi:hypothetical protein ACTA71_008035 [Dictyostelium dimigraforme]